MLANRLLDLFTKGPLDLRPLRGLQHLYRQTVVPASLEDTFEFFADATKLQLLTPDWLNFRMLTPSPVVMREGLLLDYTITLFGVPLTWRSRIDVWEPGVRFVDRQIAGPYRWWHHEHRFEPLAGGTRVIDHVEYVPRAGWISGGFVRRDLNRIFAFRHQALQRLFEADRRSAQVRNSRRCPRRWELSASRHLSPR